ncbi:MAG: hypothetical protein GXY19_01265 [Phycisphaerae bacterium]|nr:hypothetical protein [Phycisphaerae bacterium]
MMRARAFRTFCCGVLLVAWFSWGAKGAEFAGGTGEAGDPYRIATAEQLVSIADDADLLSKHFLLVEDLDLDPNLPGGFGPPGFSGAVIAHDGTPNASPHPAFVGRFYGDGHTIRNLTIRTGTGQYLGLFGAVGEGGRVYDLHVENVSIEGPGRAGALAGSNRGSLVNCHATGTIRCPEESNWVGGLVGVNEGGIGGCSAAVTVTAGGRCFLLGGLAGLHRGRIANCGATGDIVVGRNSFDVGGLVGGCLGGAVENSHATGSVMASDGCWSLGGFVGSADSNASIVFCYASGGVTAGAGCRDMGGFVGRLQCEASDCYATGDVTTFNGSHSLGGLAGSLTGGLVVDSYAMGAVTGGSGSRSLGGLIGRVGTAGDVTNCYATGRLLRNGAAHDRGGLIGTIESGRRVRVTRCFWDRQESGASQSAAGVGLTTAQMQDVETFRTARWDLAGVRSDGTADTWRMAGEGGYPQLAAFGDPNDLHALEGAGTSYEPYEIGTVEDLGAVGRYSRYAWYKLVADIDMAGITWARPPIPVLRGYFNGNGHRIANLTVEGETAGDLGLFGRIENDAWVYDLGLDNVSVVAEGDVTSVGGLAGTNAGMIIACYVTGSVAAGPGTLAAGGIAGSDREGVVADSYATAVVSCQAEDIRIGGLVGLNYAGIVSGCYAAGHVTGAKGSRYAGPLVGRDMQFSLTADSYFPSAGGPGAPGGNGLGTPLTDEQMKQQASFVDWDFAKTWTICEGQTYPRLLWEQFPCDP